RVALTRYHPNGYTAESQDFRRGQPFGRHAKFFDDGKVSYEVNYVAGKKHGTETGYYPDGSIEFKRDYAHGKPIGSHFSYFPDHTVRSTSTYSPEGIPTGPTREFYPDGSPKAQYQLNEDTFAGEYIEWHPNGQ